MPLVRTRVVPGIPFWTEMPHTQLCIDMGVADEVRRVRLEQRTIEPTGYYFQARILDGPEGNESHLAPITPEEAGVLHDQDGYFIINVGQSWSTGRIIRSLARTEPLGNSGDEAGACVLCQGGAAVPRRFLLQGVDPVEFHAVTCPWRQAVEWTRGQIEEGI